MTTLEEKWILNIHKPNGPPFYEERFRKGGLCYSHQDNHLAWDCVIVTIEVFSAKEGSGVYETRVAGQNGENWTPHHCDVGDCMVILRPVRHRVGVCRLPEERLKYQDVNQQLEEDPKLKKYNDMSCWKRCFLTPDQYEEYQTLRAHQKRKEEVRSFMHETARLKIGMFITKVPGPTDLRRRLQMPSSFYQYSAKPKR